MSNYTVIKPPSLSCTDGAVTCATNSMQANAIRSNNIIREAGGMKGGNKNTNIEFQSAAISNNESSKIAGAVGKNITELLNQEIENSKYDKMAGGKRKSKKIKKRKSKKSKRKTRKIKGGNTVIGNVSKMLSEIFAVIAKASDKASDNPVAETPDETPVETPVETRGEIPNSKEGGKQKKKSIKNKPKIKRRKNQKK